MNVYWLEQTEESVPVHDAWLSLWERNRLQALRVPKRRADWRLGRWTAKRAVSQYFGLPDSFAVFSTIEIKPAASGAPEVFVEQEPAPLELSLSHREGRAVCAIAGCGSAIGCDLEFVEPRSDAFLADYFTGTEQAFINRDSCEETYRAAALLWSAKESALKALHSGLLLDTRSVTVAVGPLLPIANWLPLRVDYVGGERFHGWWSSCGKFVRTMVAAPRPGRPISLDLASESRAVVRTVTAARMHPEYV